MNSTLKPYGRLAQIFKLSSERVIAFARLILTAFAFIAIFLDPPQELRAAEVTNAVAIGYLAFAVLSFCFVLNRLPGYQVQLLSHIVDILCVCLLMHFNQGPNSPFFVFFTFILLSATLRWGWRGAISTTVLLALMFLLLVLLINGRSLSTDIGELSRTILRPAYLTVVGVMLGYVGALQDRSRLQLAKLAAWPGPDYGQDVPIPIKSALAHASEIMRTPRVLTIWEPLDEPFREVVLWSKDRLHYSREHPDRFGTLVAPTVARLSFAVPPGTDATGALIRTGATVCELVNEELRRTYSIQNMITAPFLLPSCKGRIFLLDGEAHDKNDLLLVDLIATRIGVDLEHHWLRNELAATAKSKERELLARDLHDGVLQGLAAANIQLRLSSSRADEEVAGHLDQTRQILAAEQQRIRTFVEDSRSPPGPFPGRTALGAEVNKLLTYLGQQWGCQIHVTVDPPDLQTTADMARNVRHILAEAISNAVRHGKASHVDITVSAGARQIRLKIKDDGRGFSNLHGLYSGEELSARSMGPTSLLARARHMGGTLVLLTSTKGTEIDLEVPV